MEENKELIYTSERIELFPTELLKEAQTEAPMVPTRPAPPSRRRGLAGLMIGVAVFAMAFLLCDGVYTLRQSEVGEETSEWLSQFLTDSFAQGTETVVTSSSQPVLVSTAPTDTDETTSPSDTTSEETTALIPTLMPEELYTYDLAAVPSGMIPIVPMDLSLTHYGESFHYI